MKSATTISLTSALVALAVGAPRPAAAQDSSLAGAWDFNMERSDNPAEQMQAMRQAGGRQGDATNSGGRRGSRGGARTGRRPGGSGDIAANRPRMSPEAMQATMGMVRQSPRRFVLEIGQDSIAFIYTDRPAVRIELGEKWKEERGDGVSIEWKAEWRDRGLRVERQVSRGGKLREDFRIAEDGTLEVVTRLEMGGGQRALEFTRVYDRG